MGAYNSKPHNTEEYNAPSGNVFIRVITETIQIAQAVGRNIRRVASLGETVNVSDAVSRIRRLVRTVTETEQVIEAAQRIIKTLRIILVQGREDILLRIQGRQDVLKRIQGQEMNTIRIQGRQDMAVTEAIEFFRGEDVTLELEQTTTGVTGGPDVNITGWALVFSMKKKLTGAVVLTKSIGSGITITSGSEGRADVVLSDTDTDTMVPGDYVYDLKRDDPGAEAILTVGTITVKEKVST